MSDIADAAMIAIDKALRKPLLARALTKLGIRPPKRMPIEARKALRTLRRQLAGHQEGQDDLRSAIDLLAIRIGPQLSALGWDALLFDPYEVPSTIDEGEAELARSLILRGEFDDGLHHLERALPAEYAVIAERLAHHLRSRP